MIGIDTGEYFVLVARTSTSVELIFQRPMSTPSMVVWWKVAEELRMKRVMFNIERARRDAKVLTSGVVGSSHEITPFEKGRVLNDGVCAELLSYSYRERHGLSLRCFEPQTLDQWDHAR